MFPKALGSRIQPSLGQTHKIFIHIVKNLRNGSHQIIETCPPKNNDNAKIIKHSKFKVPKLGHPRNLLPPKDKKLKDHCLWIFFETYGSGFFSLSRSSPEILHYTTYIVSI